MYFDVHKLQKQRGFSLIELMVGLTIGLIVTLAVFQTMGLFETQKRSTTATADVQTNGNIALFTIARDMKQAGFALMPDGTAGSTDYLANCTTLNLNSLAGTVTSLNPVDITNGAAVANVSNAFDTITIRYGTATGGGAITELKDASSSASTPRKVDSNLGCAKDDVVVINQNGTCDLSKITAISAVTTITDPSTVTLADAKGAAGSNFSCLGAWSEVTYSLSNGNLVRSVNGGAGENIVSDVVDMQAQYGISSLASSNQINQWVEPTGNWAAGTITAANRKLIKAIRVAVIVRNPQIDSSAVSTACDQSTSPTTGVCAWDDVLKGGANTAITADSLAPVVDLSKANPTNWTNYHYRVFETVIPLRNTIWAKDSL